MSVSVLLSTSSLPRDCRRARFLLRARNNTPTLACYFENRDLCDELGESLVLNAGELV